MALKNLAAEPRNHKGIVMLGSTGALIGLLQNNLDKMESGRYAAFALSNLTTNINHRQQIVVECSIELLIGLACSMDPNAQWQALAALRGIFINPKFRTKAIKLGVLYPLV